MNTKLKILKVNEEILRKAYARETDFQAKMQIRKALEYLMETIKTELQNYQTRFN
jgi:hypothetical protein